MKEKEIINNQIKELEKAKLENNEKEKLNMELKEEINKLKQEIEQLQSKMINVKEKKEDEIKTSVNDKIQAIEKKIEETSAKESISQINDLNRKIKSLEDEKQKYKKNISEYQSKIESLNKLISDKDGKNNDKISLIFELDKTLMGMKGEKKQFIIKDKRDKKLIQIINKLFIKYPLLKILNIKSFENKNESKKINYYGNAKENNLNDNSIISINLE